MKGKDRDYKGGREKRPVQTERRAGWKLLRSVHRPWLGIVLVFGLVWWGGARRETDSGSYLPVSCCWAGLSLQRSSDSTGDAAVAAGDDGREGRGCFEARDTRTMLCVGAGASASASADAGAGRW